MRFEVPSLFEQASPGQIVENVASIRFNTLMCTVQPAGLHDARLAEMIAAEDLANIIKGTRGAGAAGIALFSYMSLFDPKYRGLGYLEALRPLFEGP